MRAPARPDRTAPEIPRGTEIGRYVVLGPLRGATTWPLEDIRALADANATNNDRKELVGLIDLAMKLRGNAATVAQ